MHGARRGKLTDYGTHLREKQFRKYFALAERTTGNTGKVLMGLLERRLDNIVYRLGFGSSRAQARQWVAHGHFLVNGRRVDIPSYSVSVGDVITVRNRQKSTKVIKETVDDADREVPDFLFRDNAQNPKGVVMRLPLAEDVPLVVNSALIVELCSK